ncbi:putative membrane-associated kinase regulator 4 [Heracleum sosnowskyi]|uniref:Membrane-associated kinase regulator 4 n=1 Tax=Heracleum sosnowskyi TaxID=360622 RepID=A0AAD8GVN6_9APIA|nr:putative membrane-associated kinase regulator 4 [Heracleum sosnowskyi]
MTTKFHPDDHEEEDYIEMEVSSHSDRFVGVMSSTTHPLDFEFQMYSSSLKRDTTISPADELFYKGKLLPLHLPPRLQMVEKLLQNSKSYDTNTFEELFSTPLAKNIPANSTPLKPHNISPSESWQFSRKLNPPEYSDEVSTEMSGLTKKSWTRKLKLVKQASLSSKLKFSRAYFKSLFAKPGCADEPSNNHIIIAKNPFQKIQTEGYEMQPVLKSFANETSWDNGASNQYRRSFSGVIKWFSPTKSSTSFGSFYKSSSSNASEKCQTLQPLNRSSSTNPDIENSIQGAIAHCKRSSRQQLHSRKYGSDMGFFSSSASRIIIEDHERLELCRG